MIPYIHSATYYILGIPLQTWGTFVAVGFALATYLIWKRAGEKKLDQKLILDLAFWMFIGAFIGARVFHVLFYEPQFYFTHPFAAIDPRQPGFAIFGGFLGAAIPFFWMMYKRSIHWIEYADVIMWGVPWGCGVGRIGCFLIHDHPGTLTHFILGVKYPDGSVRHDLGLYLSIIGFLTGGLFIFLNRKQRRPGFWFGTYMMIEGGVRFGTDFLRVADTRYFALTPTQYLAIPLLIGGIWMTCYSHDHV
ncbi:prolipoprotein diacylglyceryl transferase [Candidatus Uhrbacteria bacterium]|nr:prolipoprotein diacylglyceryl transferase [Candidatus Uhrbacteria bacterium]